MTLNSRGNGLKLHISDCQIPENAQSGGEYCRFVTIKHGETAIVSINANIHTKNDFIRCGCGGEFVDADGALLTSATILGWAHVAAAERFEGVPVFQR